MQIYHLIIRLIFEGGSISEPHKFIKKTMKDLGYPPKELLYFIRSVLDDDSGIFKDDILNEIKNLDKQLQKISDEGEEGIIH